MNSKTMRFPGYPEPAAKPVPFRMGDTSACGFPDPDYWEYGFLLWDLEKEDPEIRQHAVDFLQARVVAGDSNVMALLGRFCCSPGASPERMEMGLRWHIKAVEYGNVMSYDRLLRAYRHPEDTTMAQCVTLLQAEGWTEVYLAEALRQHTRECAEETGKEGTTE